MSILGNAQADDSDSRWSEARRSNSESKVTEDVYGIPFQAMMLGQKSSAHKF